MATRRRKAVLHLNSLDWAALVLSAIGAINWGLIGLFGFNLIAAIFGGVPALVVLFYILIGLAGLWLIYMMVRAGQRVPAPPTAPPYR
jgi:uncharacterized membrane protein YuzA (DUF378 family)